MNMRIFLGPLLLGSALSLGACADNYAAEGGLAGAAAGAGVAAATGGDVGTGAAIGAAAGAAGGSLIKKDGKCYRRDRYGDRYEVRCPR
ncbi:glycine zipper domain-containing protein [Altericroceibacterium spongiae]|uniref:glycine zipper domain-containing protein n=1 Tax=Altericroceibacterium spongiae TaxID=2320269 RepID=UPI001EE59D25|nr:glycine zipper domain-containing protein [Altericroceibacterium spongiae]